MTEVIRNVDVKEAAELLVTGQWIATSATTNEDGTVKSFVCKAVGSCGAAFRVYSQICEIREVDTKEAAQLLNTGEWIATCAAVGPKGLIKFLSCGRIRVPNVTILG